MLFILDYFSHVVKRTDADQPRTRIDIAGVADGILQTDQLGERFEIARTASLSGMPLTL